MESINQKNIQLEPVPQTIFQEKNTFSKQPMLFIVFVFFLLLGTLLYQNFRLQKELRLLRDSSKQTSSLVTPTESPKSGFIKQEALANWQTKLFSIGGNTYSLKYPKEYFFEDNILSNYKPSNREKPSLGFAKSEGKCDFGEIQKIPLSLDSELVTREKINSSQIQIEKITEKSLNPGPGPEIYNYFLIGSQSPYIFVTCYGSWQNNSTEILPIINTIELNN